MFCQPLITTYLIVAIENMLPKDIFTCFISFHLRLLLFNLLYAQFTPPQPVCKVLESLHGDSTYSIGYKNIHGINSQSISLFVVVAMCL